MKEIVSATSPDEVHRTTACGLVSSNRALNGSGDRSDVAASPANTSPSIARSSSVRRRLTTPPHPATHPLPAGVALRPAVGSSHLGLLYGLSRSAIGLRESPSSSFTRAKASGSIHECAARQVGDGTGHRARTIGCHEGRIVGHFLQRRE